MRFTISADKNEQVKLAESSEYTSYNNIETPGAYVVNIDSMELVTVPSGAKFIEFRVTTIGMPEEATGKINLLITTKNGSSTYSKNGKDYDLPGVNHIRGSFMILMGVNDLEPMTITKDGKPHLMFKSMENKKIGVLLDIKKTKGKNDKVYFNQELVGFYNPETEQTATEFLKGEPPTQKAIKQSKLKIIDETLAIPKPNTENPFEDSNTTPAVTTSVDTQTPEKRTDFWVE